MKAIIYTRVSTKDQADHGYSLESQKKDCSRFAENHGYEIEKIFVERGESAKTQDRTELQKILQHTAKNKGKIQALIVWKLDRFSRNVEDYVQLKVLFSKLGIRILSVTENNESTADGELMRNIHSVLAQYENDIKKERTVKGMQEKLRQGLWCWRPPVGYRRELQSNAASTLVPSDDAHFIQEAFKLAETGLYKQTEIVPKLRCQGFKQVTKSLLSRILTNHLYAGVIWVPRWFKEKINASHKPLVTMESFAKVQAILKGKRPSLKPHARNNPDFPLRGFVRCTKCGQKLTGGWSTGQKKVKYAYYHCHTPGCRLNVNKRRMEGLFYEHLKSFEPKPEVLALFEKVVVDVWKAKLSDQIKEEHCREKKLTVLEAKKSRIDELMIKGTFDEDTYKQQAESLKNEIIAAKIEWTDAKVELNDIDACLNYCKFFLANIANLWANSELNLKQRFQQLLFPGEIYFEGNSFRTTAISPIFKEIQAAVSKESYLASPRGFEPLLPG